jgi:hypothetical protein
MARQRLVTAPPRNDVYVGMLGLSALAMLLGIVVLVLELGGDYDFESQAKGGPAISLPKDFSRPTPKSDGPAPTPAPGPTTKAEPVPAAIPVPTPEAAKPAVIVTLPLPPAPLPAAVPAAVPVVPAADPGIVRPGFTPRFPRQ